MQTKELTLRSVVLGVLLSCLMAAANAYLGLKVGMTVSASIPAAVISMYILKLFKNSSILENNIVQTAASSGEALAAGAVFVLPALVILQYWTDFPFLPTLAITAVGGILGVLFTIPLRRILIVNGKLKFPEGIATAEVLKAGHGSEGKNEVKNIVFAGVAAAFFKLCQSGFKLLASSVSSSFALGKSIFAFGLDLSPALLAVGYIVGLNIAVLMFAGGVIAWFIAIPIFSAIHDISLAGGFSVAMEIWSTKVRYLGIGAMVTGGVWTLIPLTKAIFQSLKNPLSSNFRSNSNSSVNVLSNESLNKQADKDISLKLVILSSALLSIPLFIVFSNVIDISALEITNDLYLKVILFGVVFSLFAGFVFSSVAGYMAGLVGSSNNPISPATIASILVVCAVLLSLLGSQINFELDVAKTTAAAATALLVGAVVCCAAAIAGDNMQDLKSGHLLGATPYKQQIMQIVGVLAGAVAISPVLSLLFNAYGFGGVMPKGNVGPEMNPSEVLAAPQATIMASLTQGAFAKNLEWEMMSVGAILAVLIILVDGILKFRKSDFRVPVLAVAVGLYLPITLTASVFLGGLVSFFANKKLFGKTTENKKTDELKEQLASNKAGILLASGLITGEALMGIFLAIPFVLLGSTNALALLPKGFEFLTGGFGLLSFAAFSFWLYGFWRKER